MCHYHENPTHLKSFKSLVIFQILLGKTFYVTNHFVFLSDFKHFTMVFHTITVNMLVNTHAFLNQPIPCFYEYLVYIKNFARSNESS